MNNLWLSVEKNSKNFMIIWYYYYYNKPKDNNYVIAMLYFLSQIRNFDNNKKKRTPKSKEDIKEKLVNSIVEPRNNSYNK